VHDPALTAEAAQRLHDKLDTLSSTCDELAKRNLRTGTQNPGPRSTHSL